MLAFLYSFDEAVISSFLTSAKFTTMPIQIINYMEFQFDPTVAAIATILMASSLIIMLVITLINMLSKTKNNKEFMELFIKNEVMKK